MARYVQKWFAMNWESLNYMQSASVDTYWGNAVLQIVLWISRRSICNWKLKDNWAYSLSPSPLSFSPLLQCDVCFSISVCAHVPNTRRAWSPFCLEYVQGAADICFSDAERNQYSQRVGWGSCSLPSVRMQADSLGWVHKESNAPMVWAVQKILANT